MNSIERERLIRKYNVPGPRYTSYPTVPYWDNSTFSPSVWTDLVGKSFIQSKGDGISLYIHLPYCESLCTFCGCNTRITVNHGVEIPYIEAVWKEWDLYLGLMKEKPLVKEIHLGGGTPTFFSPQNLKMLLEGILSKVNVASDAEFGFEGHPKSTSLEHLEVLYKLGFRRLSLGIQDFDPKVQEVINRIQSFEKVKEVTENARSVGYTSINFDLVYGLPLQTKNSIVDTIEKIRSLKPDRIAFYSYAHVPWIKPGQRKFTELDLPDDDVKRGLYECGRTMLEEAGYHEVGMDHFALTTDSLYIAAQKGTLHRNFMGYTPSKTDILIGLGVSSISDLWGAYAQNVKTVEEYIKTVKEGKIPVFRGHVLNREDLVLRKHILNLMCLFETNWHKEEDYDPTLEDAVNKLKEMEEEGLVELPSSGIRITEKGRPFLRNVCMALDARMWARAGAPAQFSKVV